MDCGYEALMVEAPSVIRVLTNVPRKEHLSTKFWTRREFWTLTNILFLLLRSDRLISRKITMGLWNAVGFLGFGGWEGVQCTVL